MYFICGFLKKYLSNVSNVIKYALLINVTLKIKDKYNFSVTLLNLFSDYSECVNFYGK